MVMIVAGLGGIYKTCNAHARIPVAANESPILPIMFNAHVAGKFARSIKMLCGICAHAPEPIRRL